MLPSRFPFPESHSQAAETPFRSKIQCGDYTICLLSVRPMAVPMRAAGREVALMVNPCGGGLRLIQAKVPRSTTQRARQQLKPGDGSRAFDETPAVNDRYTEGRTRQLNRFHRNDCSRRNPRHLDASRQRTAYHPFATDRRPRPSGSSRP
jgi:hypothetical protein